ncbi:MAG: hypothetical protein AVDCRST_MAG43-2176 [uncultured Thermomicrobiales bacterium]|uniref:Uncharacterized protein n=1 Tax=uncultured Thermomicrobiales bacterium TaxID=1645740 RepID=A0A6J4V1G6_9BACT|nr:MAG: hypothetical protein AVDCRST_MAG43-2176 [uncultured Thermomicrobiales bacterium]
MGLERSGTALLVLATLVVAASILAGGDVGRALNAFGGIGWFLAAGMLVSAAVRSSRQYMTWAAVIGLTAVVAFVVRPSDLILAAVGFGSAGIVVGTLAQNRELLWVTLVPALYLPFHIGTAVLKATVRSLMGTEPGIRSDPPPTAAIVPIVMVVAALAGGYAAMSIKAHRSDPDEGRFSPTSPHRRA